MLIFVLVRTDSSALPIIPMAFSFSSAQRNILEYYSPRYTEAVGNSAKIRVLTRTVAALTKAHEDSKTTKALPETLHQVSWSVICTQGNYSFIL